MTTAKLRLRLRTVIFLVGAVFAGTPAFGFQLDLQKLGDALQNAVDAFEEFDENQEVEIGQGMAAALLGAAPLVEDAEVQNYVNRVGRWLAMHSERPDLPWTFAVIKSDSFNAFAAPGGYVFVTEGLFSLMRTEAELAGVLAHEMGHVLAKHHLNAIQAGARRELAADVLTEFAASQNQSLQQNKQLFSALVDSGVSLYASGLDREDELESDLIGVVLAARAGYEPFGLPGTLLALEALKSGDERLSLMSSTHPTFRERLQHLDEHMGESLDGFAEQPVLAERFLKTQGRLGAQ